MTNFYGSNQQPGLSAHLVLCPVWPLHDQCQGWSQLCFAEVRCEWAVEWAVEWGGMALNCKGDEEECESHSIISQQLSISVHEVLCLQLSRVACIISTYMWVRMCVYSSTWPHMVYKLYKSMSIALKHRLHTAGSQHTKTHIQDLRTHAHHSWHCTI